MASVSPSPKYAVEDPTSEIIGMALLSLLESQNLDSFRDLVEKYGMDQVQPDEWYPADQAFRFLQELVARDDAMFNLVSIGMKVFDVMPMPASIETVADALRAMEHFADSSQRRRGTNVPWYSVREINEHHIEFVDRGSYPHDLIYGEVYSLVRRFRSKGTHFAVTRDYLNPDDPDADGAVYHIEIK